MDETLRLPDRWEAEVADVRSFLDENYAIPLSGGGYARRALSQQQTQLPWGRIGIERFCERVQPVISGVDETSGFWSEVITSIKKSAFDAVAFGNSTMIVDEDATIRISTPEHGTASRDPWTTTFIEIWGDTIARSMDDGVMTISTNGGNTWKGTGSMSFPIFYGQDGAHPQGASRLSPAVRNTIRAASRNKARAEIAAQFYAFPQRIFNGVWEELETTKTKDGLASMSVGAQTIAMIPAGPNGEKMDVTQLPAASFEPFIDMQRSLAIEAASGLGLAYSDLGVTTAQPQSADQIYALKETLSIAITSWEMEITPSIQAMLVRLAEIRDEGEEPVLTWAEPSTPSKASAADAAVKIVGAFPALRDSPAVLRWAGIPQTVLQQAMEDLGIDKLSDLPVFDPDGEVMADDEE